MKTISGYQEIRMPDGSTKLIWVGGAHQEGFYSNGFIDAGSDITNLGPLPKNAGIALEKTATFSLSELFKNYWIYLAVGLLLLIILKK